MSAVTEGIDAIATTRVLIRQENGLAHTSTHALTGETVHRTFRYDTWLSCVISYVYPTCISKDTLRNYMLYVLLQRNWGRNGYCSFKCQGLH